MVYGGGLLGLAELLLVIYCFFDVIRTPGTHVRNLPKPVWLILCFIPPILGPIAWLLFGRPTASSAANLPYKGNRGVPPEYRRPGRATASSPDDDEAFLRSLRERAEQQRRSAEQQRRSAEQQRKQREEGS